MSQKNNIRPAQAVIQSEENRLKSLLTNPQGLNSLIDFLTAMVQEADKDYTQASRKAVFEPEVRIDAVHKHGIMKGLEAIQKRLELLRNTGR